MAKRSKIKSYGAKEKALLLKIANATYLQQTKPPQPEETMKIEKKPLARSIIDNLKALYKRPSIYLNQNLM